MTKAEMKQALRDAKSDVEQATGAIAMARQTLRDEMAWREDARAVVRDLQRALRSR